MHTPCNSIRCSSSAMAVFLTKMVSLEAEVMVYFYIIQAAEMGGKKPGPISGGHDGTTILGTDQLAEVTCLGLLDYTNQVVDLLHNQFS